MRHRQSSRGRFLGSSLAAVGGSVALPQFARAADETYTLRANLPTGPNGTYFAMFSQLARGVERRSNGRLKIEVYPSLQLAKEQETVDALRSGTVDLACLPSAFLESISPRVAVLGLPFLFKDTATMYRVLDGPIGVDLFADLAVKDILGLTWHASGFRDFDTAPKPINTLADLKGLRFRVPAGPVFTSTLQALGAVPLTIDYSETFVAVTQHTLDGILIPVEEIANGKWWTVIKYIGSSTIFCAISPMIASKKKIESLPLELQKALHDEIMVQRPYWRNTLYPQRAEESMKQVLANGITFTKIPYAPFRAAVESVYTAFAPKVGPDLIQRISRASA